MPISTTLLTRCAFVVDHFAKPALDDPELLSFRLKDEHLSYINSMFSLSLLPNVYVKLSGLLDSAAPELVSEAFAEYRETVASVHAPGKDRKSVV